MSEPPERGDELRGGLGGTPTFGIRDLRLMGRYGVPEHLRADAVKRIQKFIEKGQKPRTVLAAIRALLAMEKINQDDEKRAAGIPDQVIVQQVAVGADVDRLCDRMLGEVEYERLQRDRAVSEDADPGTVGPAGERRAVDPPTPPGSNGRGLHGRGKASGNGEQ